MAHQSEFYMQQAENCGTAAAAATLANERDKYLQAQAAWQALAAASAKIRDGAAKRDALRAGLPSDA